MFEEPENISIHDFCDCLLEIVKFFKLFGKAISLAFSGKRYFIQILFLKRRSFELILRGSLMRIFSLCRTSFNTSWTMGSIYLMERTKMRWKLNRKNGQITSAVLELFTEWCGLLISLRNVLDKYVMIMNFHFLHVLLTHTILHLGHIIIGWLEQAPKQVFWWLLQENTYLITFLEGLKNRRQFQWRIDTLKFSIYSRS